MTIPIKTTPDYIPVEKARAMPGLRIAFTRGVPGAWSVAAKAIFDIKAIDYVAVPQEPGGANEALKAWTGQTSAPVAMFNDDRTRPLWSEMLVLAEQLQPDPPLIPADEDERMAMFGLCHEMCGDDGLGWNVRLLALSAERAAQRVHNQALQSKYTSPVTDNYARHRLSRIIDAMTRRLKRQEVKGSRYFMGNKLTAPDIYWASFSNLFEPMSEELCTIPDSYRSLRAVVNSFLDAPLPQILLDHRDYVARNYFRIPISL
jgi:glutathione S-transferase